MIDLTPILGMLVAVLVACVILGIMAAFVYVIVRMSEHLDRRAPLDYPWEPDEPCGPPGRSPR